MATNKPVIRATHYWEAKGAEHEVNIQPSVLCMQLPVIENIKIVCLNGIEWRDLRQDLIALLKGRMNKRDFTRIVAICGSV